MFDVHQTIFDRHGESDEILIQKYIEGLMAEFAESSEAQPVEDTYGEIGWAATMMHYAINYMGCTPPEMTLPDFSEVLFELFPRKVSVEADQAGAIVAELQAFWRFMARQYGLDNAGRSWHHLMTARNPPSAQAGRPGQLRNGEVVFHAGLGGGLRHDDHRRSGRVPGCLQRQVAVRPTPGTAGGLARRGAGSPGFPTSCRAAERRCTQEETQGEETAA